MSPVKRKSPFAGFKSILLTYFNFTINERKGIIAFMILQCMLVLALIYFKYTNSQATINFSRLDAVAAAYDSIYVSTQPQLVKINNVPNMDTANNIIVETPVLSKANASVKPDLKKLFLFNPNHLPDSQWMALGLSEKQIRVTNNYQTKGGKFYSKADVKKMYCINESQYAKLEPYINLPDQKTPFYKDTSVKTYTKLAEPKTEIKIASVELNIANEEDLITIPGIGPARASAIIKYREKLGGYMELEQVKEAYGMDSVFDRIKKYLQLELYTTRFININTAKAVDFKHPYLTPSSVTIIINYRNEHGSFTKVDELKKLNILDEITYKKLEPYLRVK